MTLQEQLKTVAEYDGWMFESEEWDGPYKLHDSFWYYADDELPSKSDINDFDYNTNISSLWDVAGRVVKDLNRLQDAQPEWDQSIRDVFVLIQKANNTFDISQLFTSVVDGIVLLKKYKQP